MYQHHTNSKELMDAFKTKYGIIVDGAELFIMEQYHDYKMTDQKSILSRLMKYSA
jgi:hypothetical protein